MFTYFNHIALEPSDVARTISNEVVLAAVICIKLSNAADHPSCSPTFLRLIADQFKSFNGIATKVTRKSNRAGLGFQLNGSTSRRDMIDDEGRL